MYQIHPSSLQRPAWLATVAMMCLCAVSLAHAQDAEQPTQSPPDFAVELRDVVRDLDAGSYATREEATDRLGELVAPEDVLLLESVLEYMELTPEQRNRVLMVIRRQILSQRVGAIGVVFDAAAAIPRQLDQPWVCRIRDVVPGFPAAEVLRPGDEIVAIDGEAMTGMRDFQLRIQQRAPGDVVSLSVVRQQRDQQGNLVFDQQGRPVPEMLELDVELGEASRFMEDPTGDFTNVVETQRWQEVEEIIEAHTPPPHDVEVEEFDRAFDPDRHPAIRQLQRDLAAIERGDLTIDRQMRDRWLDTADMLERQKNDPRLASRLADPWLRNHESNHRREVQVRFLELVTRALGEARSNLDREPGVSRGSRPENG